VGTPSLVLRQTLSPVPLPAVQAVRFLATPVRVPLQVRSVVLSAVSRKPFYRDGFELNRRNRRISNSSIIAFAKRATSRLPGNSGPEPHIQPVLIEPQLNATR
jgi:hypothetical protein